MQLRKMIFCLFLVVGILFSQVVEAGSPQTFSLFKGEVINYNEDIVAVPGDTHAVYFTNKGNKSGNYLVLCTGDRDSLAGYDYSKISFASAKIGAGVAAIIISGVGENATTSSSVSMEEKRKIFLTQLAIWKYLGESFNYTENNLSTSQRTIYNNLRNAAATAEGKYDDIYNFTITLDASSLNFTLNGDVYESQLIKVSGKEIKAKTPTVNKGTVEEKNGGYVVKVPKSSLSEGKNTITLKIDATSNSVALAANYSSGNSSQQTTTTTQLDYYSKTASKSISGEIVIVPTKVTISKQDITTGKELPGASLELTGPNNYKKTWTSGTTPYEISEVLEAGEYTLIETDAPNGYIKSTDTVTFNIDADGKLIDGPVVMNNTPKGYVYISKQDITTGKELPDAKLVLKNSKGEKIDEWTSGTTPYKINRVLEAGEYTLVETKAPDGYVKSDETVKFTVNENGEVNEAVIMYNQPKEVSNPKTGSTLAYMLVFSFVAFALGFYFYASYRLKKNM